MISWIREVALWLGAALGVLCLLWAAATLAFGITPLVFTSGSMSPEIKAGDLAFARTADAADLKVGDITSVQNSQGVRVTHRITEIEYKAEGAVLTMQGDANQSPDAESYPITSAERVLVAVPKAGYVVTWAASPSGVFVGGMLVMALLIVAFQRSTAREDHPEKPPHGTGPPGSAERGSLLYSPVGVTALALIAVLALSGTLLQTEQTLAGFSDKATMTGVPKASALPPAPVDISCTNSSGAITPGAIISWPAVPDQGGHKVYIDFRVYSDAGLTQQFTEGEMPRAPYLLAPGTNRYERVRTPLWHSGDAWVRIRSVYVDAAGSPTWYSANDRVYKLNRHTANIRTSCVEKVR